MGLDGGVCWCAWNKFSQCYYNYLYDYFSPFLVGGSVWYVTIPGCQRSDIFIATRALSPYGFFTRHIWRVHYPSSTPSAHHQ